MDGFLTMVRDDVGPDEMADPGGTPVLSGRLEPGDGSGPVLVVGDRRIPWALVGEVLAGSGGVELALVVTPTPTSVSGEASPVMSRAEGPARLAAVPPPRETPPPLPRRAGLRPPVDESEAEAWSEALTLLCEHLPERREVPVDELASACARIRAAAVDGGEVWELVGEAAGWEDGLPDEDIDLWTGGAMALISVAVDGMDIESARCLDAMELDDWLSTVLELVRSGPGTPADPDSLLALSARCLDVDTAAVDPSLAPVMVAAFRTIAPVWLAFGVIDDGAAMTPLGAWGLPYATARAWGGWLDDAT